MDVLIGIVKDFYAAGFSIITSLIANYLYDRRGIADTEQKKFFHIMNLRKFIIFSVLSFLILYLVSHFSLEQIEKIQERRILDKIKTIHEKVELVYSKFIEIPVDDIDKADPPNESLLRMHELGSDVPKIRSELYVLNDNKLSFAYQIWKYDDLAYLSAILSELERAPLIKNGVINEGLNYSVKVLGLIQLTTEKLQINDIGYNWGGLYNWLQNNNTNNRIHFVRAWLLCSGLRNKLISDRDSTKVLEEWEQVSANYIREFPPDKNPSLRFYIH